MSLESGDDEDDRVLHYECLYRRVGGAQALADRKLGELNGHDRPLCNSDGQVTHPSSIQFWLEWKELHVQAMARAREHLSEADIQRCDQIISGRR